MIRVGKWMLTNEGIFELRRHQSVKDTAIWEDFDLLYSFRDDR
jgi:hypothetical protein